MSLLSKVHRGPQQRPHFVGLYGVGGVGKSTFGAAAPSPIFLGTDDGVGTMNVASFPIPSTWMDVKAAIADLLNEKHEFESLVIDTVNGLEPLVWAHVCKESNCKSIEDVDGGFGKGYVRAEEEWIEFFKSLKRLRSKMNVICLGHAKVKTVEHIEEGERFDRYLLKMHDRSAAIFLESVECMFFASYRIQFRKAKGEKKSKAFGEGVRVMYTEERPAFQAKNRFSLPFEMDLSWDDFVTAAAAKVGTAPPDQLEKLVAGKEEAVMAYLVELKWLPAGAPLSALKTAKRKPILERPTEFLDAAEEFFSKQNEPKPTTETE